MSKTDRPTLDFFILALMADGVVVTPYTLVQRLKISPGASIPSLRRLEKQGLAERQKAGPRRRQVLTLTPKGREVLNLELPAALSRVMETVPLDPESISRIVALGRSGHGSIGKAIQFAEAALSKSIQNAKSAGQDPKPLQALSSTADIYTWALGNLEVARWKAQAIAIRRIYYRLCTKGYRRNQGRRPEKRKSRK